MFFNDANKVSVLTVAFDLGRCARFCIQKHDIADMDGSLRLHHATLSILGGRLCVAGYDVYTLNQHAGLLGIDLEHLAGLLEILVLAGNHHDGISFADVEFSFESCAHCLMVCGLRAYGFEFRDLRFFWILKHFRSEGNDLHISLVAQFTSNRAKDARSTGIVGLVQKHYSVVIETDIRSVFAPEFVFRPDDDRLGDGTLFDASRRDGVLNGYNDLVANFGIVLTAVTQDTDAEDLFGAAVIGYIQSGFLLDHFLTFLPADFALGGLYFYSLCAGVTWPSRGLQRGASASAC